MELKLQIFLLIFYFHLIEANLMLDQKKNYIFNSLVFQEGKEEAYIHQAVNTKGDIYIMASEKYNSTHSLRIYIIYEYKTSSLLSRVQILSQFNFCGGESFIFGNNEEFIFTSTVISDDPAQGSFNAFNINKLITYTGIYNFYGYRRVFIKAEPYYYLINIYSDYKTFHLRKTKFTFDGNNDPSMEIIKDIKKDNYNIYPRIKMISCDITKNKDYILCATYILYQESQPPIRVYIHTFTSDLELKSTKSITNMDNINIDYFIKIVHLKDDKFFVIVPKSENEAYFNYFKYDTNTNEYRGIFSKELENSQLSSHFDSNDVIAFPPDKIIKIYVGEKIIITIFQFYENDSILSIKIYNMALFSGLLNLGQIRINMLKNSIFATYVGYENSVDAPTKGYFVVNYPNSKDISLNEDIINIKDIITLDNPIFSLELKLKILSIPTDFILINTYNSLIINVGDELETNNRIKLRQYRIDKEYNLNYVAIARGIDSGYVEKKFYSSKTIDELADNEIFCEGRQGKIIINFTDCLNGYYKFYNNMNLCSNVKPDNYYIDEINKIFKPCQSPCKECSGPIINDTNMNCISCQNNYYITEDTNSCYDKVIDNYYLDGNILRRCHNNCKSCYSKQINETHMNCKICQNNYYITEDTNSCYDKVIDNYYLDGNILRRCYEKCKSCYSKQINEIHMNCKSCFNNYYITEDTNSCYDSVKDNYYLDGNILRRCYDKCKSCYSKQINETYMNCKTCQNDYYITEDTYSCYDKVIDNYYLDENILRRCNENCKSCYSKQINETHMNCKTCLNNYYITEDTNSCYDNIVDNYYLDGNILRRCHNNCKSCYSKQINETHMNCKTCQNDYYITEDTNSCYGNVIDNYYLDGNILRRCYENCKSCYSKQINETHMNCKTCQNDYYMTEDTYSCYDKIIDNYYLDGNILRRCHPRCSKCTGAYTEDNMNCLECLDDEKNKYFYRKDDNSCILKEDYKERENKEFEKIDSKNFSSFVVILLIAIIIAFTLCILGLINKEEKKEKNNTNNPQKIQEGDENKNIELPEYKPINPGDDE